MKKYFFGLAAVTLALAFSAFTTKKAPFTNYIFKYVGPSTPTQSDLENRDNWNLKIDAPFAACTPDLEEAACSFQTAINTSYRVPISGQDDLFKPSSAIQIVGKLSLSEDEYVVDRAKKVSDNSTVSASVENINQP